MPRLPTNGKHRAAQVPTLEQRIAEAERLLTELVACPTVRRELLMQRAREAARLADLERAAAEAEAREEARPRRRALFSEFAAERLARHASLSDTAAAIESAYSNWAQARGLSGVDTMDADEIAQCVLELGGKPQQVRNKFGTAQEGYTGLCVVPIGKSPGEVVAEVVRRENAAREAEEHRLELHRLQDRVQGQVIETLRARDAALKRLTEAGVGG